MQSPIGQSIYLVTHAQAVLQGEKIEIDWRSNSWFARVAEYRFGVGEQGGPPAGEDPQDWIDSLAENGFKKAALFVEPFAGTQDVIDRLGFAGGQRMAPVTIQADGTEIIWHERPRFEKSGDDGAWHIYRGGFRVMPGQLRVHADKASAGLALDAALAKMFAFQRQYRSSESFFGDRFLQGRRQLQAAGFAPRTLIEMSNEAEILDRVRPLFPAKFDPASLSLVAAVEAAWAFGGMGWWNDWGTDDDGARMLFREANFATYEAMIACLTAACEPQP